MPLTPGTTLGPYADPEAFRAQLDALVAHR